MPLCILLFLRDFLNFHIYYLESCIFPFFLCSFNSFLISFQKAEVQLLVESTKIENATFLYKTAQSEANATIQEQEQGVENEPRKGVLKVTTLFSYFIYFIYLFILPVITLLHLIIYNCFTLLIYSVTIFSSFENFVSV